MHEVLTLKGEFVSDHLSAESSVASRTEILRDCVESNLLKAVANQKQLLPAIKVLSDWLRLNRDVVTTCVEVNLVKFRLQNDWGLFEYEQHS